MDDSNALANSLNCRNELDARRKLYVRLISRSWPQVFILEVFQKLSDVCLISKSEKLDMQVC